MAARQKYLMCPQCGSPRLCIRDADGKDHFVYALPDGTFVYTKTGEPIPEDLDTSLLRCCECSWKGPARKLVKSFIY